MRGVRAVCRTLERQELRAERRGVRGEVGSRRARRSSIVLGVAGRFWRGAAGIRITVITVRCSTTKELSTGISTGLREAATRTCPRPKSIDIVGGAQLLAETHAAWVEPARFVPALTTIIVVVSFVLTAKPNLMGLFPTVAEAMGAALPFPPSCLAQILSIGDQTPLLQAPDVRLHLCSVHHQCTQFILALLLVGPLVRSIGAHAREPRRGLDKVLRRA